MTEQLQRMTDASTVTVESADLTADINAPLPPEEAEPPVALSIPAIGLSLDIVPMGWVVTEENGQRTTQWIVPTDAIGWHANSVGAGGVGNLLLSGHQAQGDALFAPLALGDIRVDQEIELVDTAGRTFLYRVVEVSEPIPILGATEEDNNLARSYMQPSETPILTMMTGWPDFTTTHRIFAVAEYVGRGVQE
ncbi:MAG: sortase [Caldilineaceae bacterium]